MTPEEYDEKIKDVLIKMCMGRSGKERIKYIAYIIGTMGHLEDCGAAWGTSPYGQILRNCAEELLKKLETE